MSASTTHRCFPSSSASPSSWVALARTASGPVADAFVDEVGFPDGFQNHLHGLLHDLVFQHGDAQRSQFLASRFGDPPAFDGSGSVTSRPSNAIPMPAGFHQGFPHTRRGSRRRFPVLARRLSLRNASPSICRSSRRARLRKRCFGSFSALVPSADRVRDTPSSGVFVPLA